MHEQIKSSKSHLKKSLQVLNANGNVFTTDSDTPTGKNQEHSFVINKMQ